MIFLYSFRRAATFDARRRCWRIRLMSALSAFAVMMSCNTSEAAAEKWSANSGGSWNLGANWGAGTVPTATVDVAIGSNATSVVSPASITLDADQVARTLTLIPGANRSIHIDPGSNPNSRLMLGYSESPGSASVKETINANLGTGSQINVPVVFGAAASGSFTATIFSADSAFSINRGLFEAGAKWGVRILGKSGSVSYAMTPSNYSGDTTIGANGILQVDVSNAIPSGSGKGNLVLESNGQLLLHNGMAQTINGLNSTSNLALISSVPATVDPMLTIGSGDANGTFAGRIGNPDFTERLRLVKTGSGIQRLNGNSKYIGTTTVLNGTLLVNGTHAGAGNYTISRSGTLGGTGTINLSETPSSVSIERGILSPGDAGPGVLKIGGALSLSSLSTLQLEISGPALANNDKSYDQVNMTSSTASITANGAQLAVKLVGSYKPSAKDIFYVLTRADVAAFATEPFAGYPEGAQISLGGGWSGRMTYSANWTGTQATSRLTGGNDMAIYDVVLVPEPVTASLAVLGMAAIHAIRRRRTQAG